MIKTERKVRIHLRLTPDEMRIAREKAGLSGFTVSDFMRTVILRGYSVSKARADCILIICKEIDPIRFELERMIDWNVYESQVSREDLRSILEDYYLVERAISDYIWNTYKELEK